MTDLAWCFAPWVAFLLGVRFGSVYWGAAVGVGVAIVVLGRAIIRHRVHLFEVIGVLYFAGLLILLAALHPSDLGLWGRYAQAVAHGSLTVIVFGSVLIGKPFTEAYARQEAPPEVWHSKRFHELNRRISLAWGMAFLVGTASLVAAGTFSDTRQVLLRVIVPFGALVLAFSYTEKQANAATRKATRPEPRS